MKLIFPLIILGLVACNNNNKDKTIDADPGWTLLPFAKTDSVNPVLSPGPDLTFTCPVRNESVRWEEKDVFNPAALVRNDTVFLLYRAEDSIGKFAGTSRIGLAWSTDGLHFTKYPVPVLYPDNDSLKKYEWEGGCEDPRVVQDEIGQYFLTCTSYDGDKARLLIATSTDLYHWTKHGLAFSIEMDADKQGLMNQFVTSTIEVGVKIEREVKAGRVEVGVSGGSRLGIEIDRTGLKDAYAIGSVSTSVKAGPLGADAGLEGKISIISSKGNINGTGLFEKLR